MRKIISNTALGVIAAGGMLLVSCGEHDMFNPNNKADQYAANWEQKIGAIDPNQDWSMATTVKATVNVARKGNFTVKVYSSDPADKTHQAYLLAKTMVVGGTPATLTFDAVKGLDNVYVALVAGEHIGIVKNAPINNGVVEANFFSGEANKVRTRSAETFGWEYAEPVDFSLESIRKTIQDPEHGLQEEVDAKGKFCNYEFESKGEFTIYPVYSFTNGDDQIGYYYYDPKTQTVEDRTDVVLIEHLQESESLQWKWGENNYQKVNWGSGEWLGWNFSEMHSVGFAINVPAGYRVGFWVMNRNVSETKLYSNQILNSDGLYYSAVGTNADGDLYFGLEDWLQNGGHALDCNDIVFFVKNAGNNDLPTPVPPTPVVPDDEDDVEMSWILACEDLGDADDRDFNDIVLEVRKNVESNKAEVRCLAAGGTLPANIYYNGQPVGESHAMLGGETKQMINTSGTLGRFSDWKEIEADATGWTITDNIDKFQIQVTMNDKTMVGTLISAPAEGKTPHMIIVPGEWEWPIERKNINEAYPKFVDWNANASITDWNSAKEADMVVKRK